MDRVQKQVIAKFLAKEVDEGAVQDVRDVFANLEVASPFQELDTQHKQSKYFHQNFGLVVSALQTRVIIIDWVEHLHTWVEVVHAPSIYLT